MAGQRSKPTLGLLIWGGNGFLRLGAALTFILLWFALAHTANSPSLPDPGQVVDAFWISAIDGDLFHHMSITLRRVFVSFIIAMLVGSLIGIIMGRYRRLNTVLDDFLMLMLNVPALVVIVLSYIWMGLTEAAAITAVTVNKIPLVAVILRDGARAVDKDLLTVGQIYPIPRWRRFYLIFLPQIVPYLLSAARSGLSLIWKIVLVVELMGRSDGVGFQLHIFFQYFDIASILAYTFAFVIIIIVFEMMILRPLENHLTAWR